MSKSIRDGRSEYSRQTVGAVPGSDTHGLLRAAIPLRRDDGEQGETSSLEQAEEEAHRHERAEVVAQRDESLRDAPAHDEHGHQDARLDADNEPGRKGLPCELGNRRDRADERVLVAFEAERFADAKDGSVSEDGLVEDLCERRWLEPRIFFFLF